MMLACPSILRRRTIYRTPLPGPQSDPLAGFKAESEFWFDVAALAHLTHGDAVALWPDQSPNGHDATQSTPTARPVYKTEIPGALAELVVTGAGDAAADGTYELDGAFFVNSNASGRFIEISGSDWYLYDNSDDWNMLYYSSDGGLTWSEDAGESPAPTVTPGYADSTTGIAFVEFDGINDFLQSDYVLPSASRFDYTAIVRFFAEPTNNYRHVGAQVGVGYPARKKLGIEINPDGDWAIRDLDLEVGPDDLTAIVENDCTTLVVSYNAGSNAYACYRDGTKAAALSGTGTAANTYNTVRSLLLGSAYEGSNASPTQVFRRAKNVFSALIPRVLSDAEIAVINAALSA
jgi:hypothetical protein